MGGVRNRGRGPSAQGLGSGGGRIWGLRGTGVTKRRAKEGGKEGRRREMAGDGGGRGAGQEAAFHVEVLEGGGVLVWLLGHALPERQSMHKGRMGLRFRG